MSDGWAVAGFLAIVALIAGPLGWYLRAMLHPDSQEKRDKRIIALFEDKE